MSKPRFVKPSSLYMGDLIRVHGKYMDVDITRVGYVAKRDHRNRTTTYYSKDGVELVTEHGDGTKEPQGARVTLLSRGLDSKPFNVFADAETLF